MTLTPKLDVAVSLCRITGVFVYLFLKTSYTKHVLYNKFRIRANQNLTFSRRRSEHTYYIHDLHLLTPRTTRPGLRSINNTLHVPRTLLASCGDMVYSNITPRLWNSLPEYHIQLHNITLSSSRNSKHTCSCFLLSNILTKLERRH